MLFTSSNRYMEFSIMMRVVKSGFCFNLCCVFFLFVLLLLFVLGVLFDDMFNSGLGE